MENFKFHIENSNQEVIISNLDEGCVECLNKSSSNGNQFCCVNNTNKRIDFRKTKKGITLICSNEIKTTKLFKQMAEFINYAIPWIEGIKNHIKPFISEEEKKQTRRLLHNIKSQNAHNIQEIYNFAPQEKLSLEFNDQVSFIQGLILKHPTDASKLFIRMMKNNNAIAAEISVFDKLHNENPKIEYTYHQVKKVFLLVYQTFAQDFREKFVFLNINEDNTKVKVDFESFRVALYHIIENALKYTKPHSNIEISFENDTKYFNLIMSMISVKIEEDEIERIYDEDYTGINTKSLNKTGSGIGMYLVKKLLSMNNSEISIIPQYKVDSCNYEGISYCRNIFMIKIQK